MTSFATGLLGYGTIELIESGTGGAARLINEGQIIPQLGGTLEIINTGSGDGGVDLDGNTGDGVLDVHDGNNLTGNRLLVTAPLSDTTLNGPIYLGSNDVLEITSAWSLADTAVLQVLDTGPGTLRGGAITQTTGNTIDVTAGATLVFEAPFTMTGGDLANSGTVVFAANSTIGAGANFTMPTASSSITVEPGVTVNVDQANFDADGSDTVSNVITIRAGGILDLDLGTGGDDVLRGTIRLNGGELDVTTANDNWRIDGAGSALVGAETGTSQINGDPVRVGNPVTVGANATLDINASGFVWGGGADIAAGTVLRHDGDVEFDGSGPITGGGELAINAGSNVSSNQSINVALFNWDGTDGSLDSHMIAAGATLTINSPNFDSDGVMHDNVTNSFSD